MKDATTEYLMVKALGAFVRACSNKRQIHDLLGIMPHLPDYVDLPDENPHLHEPRAKESSAKS